MLFVAKEIKYTSLSIIVYQANHKPEHGPQKLYKESVKILAVAISLSLLLSLVEGNSQTFPYVSSRGQTLANHSYLDFSLVGNLNRGPYLIRLKRSSEGPEGVYKCVVRDTTHINQTVYVGIYSLNGSYVANTFCVFLCNFISVTSSSVLMTSSMVAEDSVTLTSSIFMTSETITSSTRTNNEHTTSSHSTQTQTASSEGTTTPTPTVVYGTSGKIETSKLLLDYTSSATPTQTVVHSSSKENRTPDVYKTREEIGLYWQTPTPTEPNPGY